MSEATQQVEEFAVELGKAKARKEATLHAWQVECLGQMTRRMPGFLVDGPAVIHLAGAGGNMGHVVGTHGPITIAPKTYALGERRCKETIMHELVHMHVARLLKAEGRHEASHGPTFQKTALFFGLRRYGDKTWRWKHSCRKCGYWVKSHHKARKGSMCPWCQRKGVKSVLVNRDNVKLTRAERQGLAGKPVQQPKSVAQRNVVAERAERAAKNLATWRRKQKLAETKVKAWAQKVRYYETAMVKRATQPLPRHQASDGCSDPLCPGHEPAGVES